MTNHDVFTTVRFIVTVSTIEFMIILLTLIESLNQSSAFLVRFPALTAVTNVYTIVAPRISPTISTNN